MLIEVTTDPAHPGGTRGRIAWKARTASCALGRAGIVAAKREGDGGTPAGTFALRRVLYRADRMAPPPTRFPLAEIAPGDGWCDDPGRPEYNRPVALPFAGSAERLWRDDPLYDAVVVIGHNDDPPVAGQGSAIFLHVARTDYAPTEGCVALVRDDLLALLADAVPGDAVRIVGGNGA